MTEESNKDFAEAYKDAGGAADANSTNQVEDVDVGSFEHKIQEAKDAGRLLVVEFFGPKCPACRSIVDFYGLLAQNHPNQKFAKLNVRENEEIAIAAKIEFLPTFIYYKDGVEVDREVGVDEQNIETKVNKYKSLIKKN